MNKQIKAGANIHAGDGGYGEGTQEGYDAFVKVRNKSLAQGRIRDLAEQAGFKVNWQHEDVQALKMARFEKFAELIVRECIDNVKVWEKDSRNHISYMLKRQYGVEE